MEHAGAENQNATRGGVSLPRLRAHWETLAASPGRSIAFALGLALFFCAVTELAWVKSDLNDDYTIASVLSGRLLGDDQGLCLFLNAILSNAIYALNAVFPRFNWFAVLELATAFVSYAVICYVAIRSFRAEVALLCATLVAYFSLPGCFTIDNFTYIAFICSCAGCMLLCRSLARDRHDPVDLVAGLLLLSLGSLWRNIMAWLCVPLFGLAALAIVARARAGAPAGARAVSLRQAARRLWPFVLAVLIGFGLTVYDLAVWKASPWDSWRDFNDTRSMLSDFPHYSYDEVGDELSALGVSRNDYELLFSWTTEDPDFFTTERVQAITDVAIIDWYADKTPASVVKDYAKSVLEDPETLILIIAVFSAGLLFARGRDRKWTLAVFAMALAMSLFFSAMGRLPERVHYPIWLYAFCAIGMIQASARPTKRAASASASGDALVRAAGKAPRAPRGRAIATLVSAACLLVALAPVYAGIALTVKCADNFAPERLALTFDAEEEVGGAFTEYVHAHPDNVFVLHNAGHRQLRMEHYLKAYYDDDLQRRVISLGGWLTRSPYTAAKNAAASMENPIRGLVENENALLVVSSKEQAQKVERYLQEHYYPQARAEVVDKLGKSQGYRTTLWVYRFHAE